MLLLKNLLNVEKWISQVRFKEFIISPLIPTPRFDMLIGYKIKNPLPFTELLKEISILEWFRLSLLEQIVQIRQELGSFRISSFQRLFEVLRQKFLRFFPSPRWFNSSWDYDWKWFIFAKNKPLFPGLFPEVGFTKALALCKYKNAHLKFQEEHKF